MTNSDAFYSETIKIRRDNDKHKIDLSHLIPIGNSFPLKICKAEKL